MIFKLSIYLLSIHYSNVLCTYFESYFLLFIKLFVPFLIPSSQHLFEMIKKTFKAVAIRAFLYLRNFGEIIMLPSHIKISVCVVCLTLVMQQLLKNSRKIKSSENFVNFSVGKFYWYTVYPGYNLSARCFENCA